MQITLELTNGKDHRLSEVVYQALLEAILNGSLSPGEVVSELALSRSLGISRTPVHDALRQLVQDGLVQQEPNRRAVVAHFMADDIREIFEIRALLEGESVALAAQRIDRPTLLRMRSTSESLEASWGQPGWVERWADYDEEFHGAIARSCGNRRLCQEVLRYRTLHKGLNRMHTSSECLHHALVEHLRILDALDARQPEAARESMLAHIREWQTFFVQNFSQG